MTSKQTAAALVLAWGAAGCGSEETGTGPHSTVGVDAGAGGSTLASGGASTAAGGTSAAGGSSSAGGAASTGGSSSGGGSTGGASATGGIASLGGSPNVPCPSGLPGPELVGIPTPPGAVVAGFCIDSTEVTRAQYADFLAASPAPSGQDPWCNWNTTYTPSSSWPPAGDEALPVGVDWCDASAYCKWAGKRLCGKIGGGPNPQVDLADPTKDEWFVACSAGGTRTFPYGDTYSETACNGAETPGSGLWPAGSRATCEGGYPGLFDLSGNVGDWEDSCASYAAADGETEGCLYRGGNRADASAEGLACATRQAGVRRLGSGYQGIRCCSSSL